MSLCADISRGRSAIGRSVSCYRTAAPIHFGNRLDTDRSILRGPLCTSHPHADSVRPFSRMSPVLSYSNWETGSVCYLESFESLSEGLQNALWQLGGVPSEHRTDRMSAAVNNLCDAKEFTRAYEGLLRHYRIGGQKIQAGQANENGDVEQRHYRFKQAAEQALMMRGSQLRC